MAAKNQTVILEALGSHQKRRLRLDDEGSVEFGNMLQGESDRGVVILLTSFIEDELLDQIAAKFDRSSKSLMKELTRAGGPLNTLMPRVRFAYALGIIDDEVVNDLEILKAMRNACAHSRRHIDFNTLELREALGLLMSIDDFEEAFPDGVVHKEGLRYLFIFGALYDLFRVVGFTREEASKNVETLIADFIRVAQASLDASPATPTPPDGEATHPDPTG